MTGPLRIFLVSLALLGASVSAFAVPGELNAVVRHCGAPDAESKETSEVNSQLERTLIYHSTRNTLLYLHFQPVSGGWSFTTAWNGHLPMTRGELEKGLPCFRNAMLEAAAAPTAAPAIDPTIASQTVNHVANEGTFGIPHLWLIAALVITLLIFAIIPSARQRRLAREQSKPIEHVYRKPNLDEYASNVPPVEPVRREFDQ